MELTVGSRYGKIGVEICDDHGSVAIVNWVGANRLEYLNGMRSKAAKVGDPAYQFEREAQALESGEAETLKLARLLAAAPALLEALQNLVADFDASVVTTDPMLIEARAAIAKATGEGMTP